MVPPGIDRCGKSTQVRLLTEGLNALGKTSEAIRFPNRESNIGQLINAYLSSTSDLNDQTIHLLFSANRWESSKEIESKLQFGTNLVCTFLSFAVHSFVLICDFRSVIATPTVELLFLLRKE
jgi:dTMP kinase